MNRKQKREFIKRAKDKGIDKEYIDAYIALVDGNEDSVADIKEGQKIKLNVDRITKSNNYENMSERYKEFIDASYDKVFTAHLEDDNFVSLIEAPEWLFWIGDVITEWEK